MGFLVLKLITVRSTSRERVSKSPKTPWYEVTWTRPLSCPILFSLASCTTVCNAIMRARPSCWFISVKWIDVGSMLSKPRARCSCTAWRRYTSPNGRPICVLKRPGRCAGFRCSSSTCAKVDCTSPGCVVWPGTSLKTTSRPCRGLCQRGKSQARQRSIVVPMSQSAACRSGLWPAHYGALPKASIPHALGIARSLARVRSLFNRRAVVHRMAQANRPVRSPHSVQERGPGPRVRPLEERTNERFLWSTGH